MGSAPPEPAPHAAGLARAAADPQRPQYHFLPPPSWINDPKPFFWNGEYHVYFQYCPGVPYSGLKHWGHAVSRDLVHWRELPLALSPTPGGPDQEGCWTGCVVENGGRFHILYTGIPRRVGQRFEQVQCLATSADLVTWDTYAGNPVIPAAQQPDGFGATFRDPQAWRERDGWYCVIGGNLPEGGDEFRNGVPFLYRSDDLVRWDYLHPLYAGPAARDECPDFFPLDGRHVLLSSRGETAWAIGDYAAHRFAPRTQGTVDDPLYYAAKTLLDDRGRRILFGWVREDRPREAYTAAGWSGALALPRVLSILPDGTLGQEPAPELQALRGARQHRETVALGGGEPETTLDLPGGDGAGGDGAGGVEVLARFAPNGARAFGLALGPASGPGAGLGPGLAPGLAPGPGGQGSDEILYDRRTQRLAGRPLALGEDEALTMRVFFDRSVIEVFAHGRVCKTIRSYRRPGDRPDVLRLIARGGSVTVELLDVWSIAPHRR